ncbi:sulfotransferase [Allorhizobium undicola]|uniref:sulfotransferase n=1 Tax=Allorhizobium undicola TaxID=78527 RepID=UPI003D346543
MTHTVTAPQPFAILGMPRTGTHYLEELLNAHPNVLSNGELLNVYDPNWPDKDRLLRTDRDLLELAYLRFPMRSGRRITHVGCKINEPQFQERPKFFDELARWPGLKVILLSRRNTLESLRSLVQARQSRQWLKFGSDEDTPPPPSVQLSISDCKDYFKAADDFHDRVGQSYASTSLLKVEYEKLLREPAECLEAVGRFLGVPALQLSGHSNLQRMENRPLSETVENFEELRRHFAGGPYERFFELDVAL